MPLDLSRLCYVFGSPTRRTAIGILLDSTELTQAELVTQTFASVDDLRVLVDAGLVAKRDYEGVQTYRIKHREKLNAFLGACDSLLKAV